MKSKTILTKEFFITYGADVTEWGVVVIRIGDIFKLHKLTV